MTTLRHSNITGAIIGAVLDVFHELGHGFSEKVYCRALAICLREVGLGVVEQPTIAVHFHGHTIGNFRSISCRGLKDPVGPWPEKPVVVRGPRTSRSRRHTPVAGPCSRSTRPPPPCNPRAVAPPATGPWTDTSCWNPETPWPRPHRR